MANYMDYLDVLGRLRYGVPTSEKEPLARAQALPGAPAANTAAGEEADRYSYVQPLVSRLKVSDLPFFGGSSPELQSYADAGAQQGIQAAGQGLTLGQILGGRR